MSAPPQITENWRAFWDAHADAIGTKPPPEYLAQTVVSRLQPRPGLKILEAGSGTGGLATRLLREGAEVTVLDIVPQCIRALCAHVPSDAPFHAVVGDLFRMPFPDGTFDAVFNSGVMEHFQPDDIRRGLTEMARVLKPGGRLMCIVPNARGRFYVWGKRRQETAGTWPYGPEYPQWSLAPLLNNQGLQLEGETPVGVRIQTHFLDGWRKLLARVLVAPFSQFSRTGAALWGAYLLVSCWRKPVVEERLDP
jgi:SAM-dependent methyltransferase